jgi:hypothetical protein
MFPNPVDAVWNGHFSGLISAQAAGESKPFTQTWLMETLKFSAFLNV